MVTRPLNTFHANSFHSKHSYICFLDPNPAPIAVITCNVQPFWWNKRWWGSTQKYLISRKHCKVHTKSTKKKYRAPWSIFNAVFTGWIYGDQNARSVASWEVGDKKKANSSSEVPRMWKTLRSRPSKWVKDGEETDIRWKHGPPPHPRFPPVAATGVKITTRAAPGCDKTHICKVSSFQRVWRGRSGTALFEWAGPGYSFFVLFFFSHFTANSEVSHGWGWAA